MRSPQSVVRYKIRLRATHGALMKIISSIASIRKEILALKRKGRCVGFVPTMGALHQGHLSLVRKARQENDVVVMSIFVNPKQFGKNEDLSKYPRPKKNDEMLARHENVDILLLPTEDMMYPSGYLTYVDVESLGEGLCGRSRPGHFRGVTTVVTKLLNIVQPDVMYLGQKDFQQAAILIRMGKDLNIPTVIKTCPTVREKDGLAMSSRNVYLSAEERARAVNIYQALREAKRLIEAGERRADVVVKTVKAMISQRVSGQMDYVQCVDPETLKDVVKIDSKCLIAVAVRLNRARLIDNILVKVSS